MRIIVGLAEPDAGRRVRAEKLHMVLHEQQM
jgi:hypothetical protein